MIGYIYNNPELAKEGDGYYCFLDKKPHAYWCVLRVDGEIVLLAPIFFDVMDNLPDNVIDSCPMQLSEGGQNVTIGIGRCIHRTIDEVTTEPVIFLNPDLAKKAYNQLARGLRN